MFERWGVAVTENVLIKTKRFSVTDENAVMVAAASLFLPYLATYAVLLFVVVAAIANPRVRKAMFAYKYQWLAVPYAVISIVAPIASANWWGLLSGFGFLVVLLFAQFARAVMTHRIFDKALTLICKIVPALLLCAIIEFVYRFVTYEVNNIKIRFTTRCLVFYFNPNYFGTFSALLATVCVYKFIVDREHRKLYVASGICALLCLLLSRSMFACAELLIDIIVILILCRKWKYLAITSSLLAVFAAICIAVPSIVPRLGETGETIMHRVYVWKVSLAEFKSHPLMGRGYMTYWTVYKDYIGRLPGVKVWGTQHAHNIILDSLLNFGVIGSASLWAYFIGASVPLIRHRFNKNMLFAGFALAVGIGAFCHGMVDITLLWAQPGMLFMLIMSSIGLIEREKADGTPQSA